MTSSGAEPAKAMSEEYDLYEAIRDLCQLFGLLIYHTKDSRRSQEGFLDCTIVGPGGALFWELKGSKEKATPEQLVWIAAWNAIDLEAALIRPEDLRNGRVLRDLRRISKRRASV